MKRKPKSIRVKQDCKVRPLAMNPILGRAIVRWAFLYVTGGWRIDRENSLGVELESIAYILYIDATLLTGWSILRAGRHITLYVLMPHSMLLQTVKP